MVRKVLRSSQNRSSSLFPLPLYHSLCKEVSVSELFLVHGLGAGMALSNQNQVHHCDHFLLYGWAWQAFEARMLSSIAFV